MKIEPNYNLRIHKKRAWIKGLEGNTGNIPTDSAEIVDVIFIDKVLSYKAEYEDARIAYIPLDEAAVHCEIFMLESKL